jgi:hypothetical protein
MAVYTVQFSAVAVTADQDLFEGLVPADAIVRILRIRVTQSSDAGDAESEQLRFQIKRGIGSTSGSGGTSPTANKHQTGDSASGLTWEVNNDTIAIAGGGSLTTILEEDENIHTGWDYHPTPEEYIYFSPNEEILVSLMADPADSLTMSGFLTYEEIGG